MLTGNIPEQLCGFPNLRVLDLSYDNISGSITRCIGNFRTFKFSGVYSELYPSTDLIHFFEHVEVVSKGKLNECKKIISLLRVIDLSGNNLMGEIPEGITNLSTLVTLNLSSNQLSENIGILKQLESLDLSHNHLSGRIPPSMTSMTSLSHLDLSCNNLSRPIPSTNQFGSFNNLSYEDNPDLCGPPLTTDCLIGLGDEDDQDGEEKDEEDGSEKLWLYVSMGFGFIGFWVVFGTLMIITSWRHAYFRFIDEMKDKLSVVIAIYVARLNKRRGR